jgi:3-oxoacyl-[acyl-carrier protein] reductase
MAQPELRAQAEAMVPIGRVASADEIADVVLFLLSPAARYMTGAAVAVAGGMSLL